MFFNYFYSEADLILYNKIKKYFTDNFDRISIKIKEEFKRKAQGAISSLSRTKSTRTYTLNTKTISLEDPIENMAATIIKQAASKTVDQAGDGTTTSTVLAYIH